MALTQVDAGLLAGSIPASKLEGSIPASKLDSDSQYYGFKNRIINGAMAISQRVGTTATTVGAVSVYGLDRWRVNSSQASKISFQQQTIAAPQNCGNNRYTMNVTSLAATTVGASDYYGFNQFVEAFNMQDLGWGTSGAQTVTLSFWVYASVIGTYSGAIRTGDSANYSYPFTYAVSVANTWEYKTVTIPGPTAGTWGTGNSVGLDVWFSLGTGSTFKGTAGAWAAANYVGATGEVALVNTNGATFYITGVQLEKGSTATAFDYRPYGTELQLCQRYYWIINSPQFGGTSETQIGMFTFQGTNTAYVILQNPVQMRTGPIISVSGNFQWTQNGSQTGVTNISGVLSNPYNDMLGINVISGLTVGTTGRLSIAGSASGVIQFSAEL
jgi:hypothetical protein